MDKHWLWPAPQHLMQKLQEKYLFANFLSPSISSSYITFKLFADLLDF
jgi:hypothetical protein